MKIEPNVDQVVVSIIETDKITAAGIQVVERRKVAAKGKIEFAGYNALNDDRFKLKVGDVVYFPSLVGTEIELEGQSLKILRKEDLFFKIEE